MAKIGFIWSIFQYLLTVSVIKCKFYPQIVDHLTWGVCELSLSNEELSKYWDAANTLREDLDAAEYKHIVLG